MKTYSFYDLDTGLFSDQQASCGEGGAAVFTPPGHAAIEGAYDPLSQRVNLLTGQVVDWQPPPPADDELRTWTWDAGSRRWVAQPTLLAIGDQVRRRRDELLADCDWVTTRAVDRGEPVPEGWAAYRQALRDMPTQTGFPTFVVWPVAPG